MAQCKIYTPSMLSISGVPIRRSLWIWGRNLLFMAIAGASFGVSISRADQSSRADVDAVQQLLIRLKSPDKQQSSGAAQALGGYNYIEVSQALIQAAQTELSQITPNSFVVGNSIKSLVNLATPQNIPALRQIKTQIDRIVAQGSANRSFTYISAEVELAIRNAGSRRDSDLRQLVVVQEAPAFAPRGGLSDKKLLKQELTKALTSGSQPDVEDAAKVLLIGTSSFLSDDLLMQLKKDANFEIFGRDKEVDQVIDTLSREVGQAPVLIGSAGAGKTTVVQKVARYILEGRIPAHSVYQDQLAGAYFIETTPGRIARLAKANDDNSQSAALETYLDAVLTVEAKLGIKIVLFIDELHRLAPGQVESLKTYLSSRTQAIKLVGSTTGPEYQKSFKKNPAITRRFDTIQVVDQTVEHVRKIIMASDKPRLEKRYGFRISDEAIDVVVNNANRVYAETSLIDASSKMLMTVCSVEARRLGSDRARQAITITEAMVYDFIQAKLGYPVNPLDVKARKAYRAALMQHLNEKVIGQPRMVKALVDAWMRLLKNKSKGVITILNLGPTGVGKSLLAREFAKAVFKTEKALLDVDVNQFKDGGMSNNTFFGAPNGVASNTETAGMLYDFLDDKSRGMYGGVILLNEPERGHTDFWEKLMEIQDTGKGTGGDGKVRVLNRHLIIMTSNRGDQTLYPRTMEDWTESEYKAHIATLTEERLKEVFKERTSGKDEFRLTDPLLARIDIFTAAEPIVPAKASLVAIQKAADYARKIEADFRIKIDLDSAVATEIAKASYQKGIGVRPVEKKVEELLEAAIDLYLIENETNRDDLLRISLSRTGTTVNINVQGPRGSVITPIPTLETPDPLSDPELLERLDRLDVELSGSIVGQDDVIGRIREAVIAHQANKGIKPLNLFLVGTTGTGKSEIGKALAKALYRSESRVLTLSMGDVIYEGELNNMFGAPAGHEGAQLERSFETFLRENPQGGVIMLDEISNMGGKDPAQKEALFKKFYGLLEEGTWTSPATGKVYPMHKYTILANGNDLQELLQGVAADDIRVAIWQKNKSTVRKLLRNAGVPEAFLGRMADVFLMKPLLKTEVGQITRKILDKQTAEFIQKGLNIRFDEAFVQDVSEKFFSQDQGARSIRNLVEFRVKSAITQLIIRARGIQNLKGQTIQLSLQDNNKKRTYVLPSDPERKVTLRASVIGNDNMSITLDATEYATRVNLQSRQGVLQTSYHEAGHAVVNDPRITGERVAMITVVGQDNYLGYARYEEILGRSQSPTAQKVVVDMAKLLAGQAAERLAGFQPSAGWANDLEKARGLATKFVLDWGLGKDMAAVQVDSKGKPRLSGAKSVQFQKEMDRLFAEAQSLAEKVLREKWNLVRAVVGELYSKGQITGERFSAMESQMMHKPGLSTWVAKDGSDRLLPNRYTNSSCTQILVGGQ